MMRRLITLFVMLMAFLTGAAALAAPAPRRPAKPALVLAAASLQESMNAAADAWARKGHPRPRISFAASSALARQVAAGARADLFISADENWMNDLQAKGLIKPATRMHFLNNRLALIATKSSTIHLRIGKGMPLEQALRGGRLAIADPAGVPVGVYGKQALTALGVWTSVQQRIAPADSVRSALALVSRGAAPLGIVYTTDAAADPGVRIVGIFPASSHAPISYPIAALKDSRSVEADAFRRYLVSPEGKAVFRRFGFGTR